MCTVAFESQLTARRLTTTDQRRSVHRGSVGQPLISREIGGPLKTARAQDDGPFRAPGWSPQLLLRRQQELLLLAEVQQQQQQLQLHQPLPVYAWWCC